MSEQKYFDLSDIKKPYLRLLDEEDDTDSGSASGSDSGSEGGEGSGGSGFIEPILDMAIFGFAHAEIREGERKFGRIPDPKDPYLQEEKHGKRAGKRLQSHPLLSNSAQFSGIDKHLTPNPPDNPDAARTHEQQLQNQLKPGMRPGQSSAPQFRPV